MTMNQGKNAQDTERDLLLKRMTAARVDGDRQEAAECLVQAKRRLSNNYVGDNPIRDAQSRLLMTFPPIR